MDQFLTVLLTIISGVVLFVLCEYVKEIWLNPLQQYKLLKEKVSYLLNFYAGIYSDPIDIAETDDIVPDLHKKVHDDLRQTACELRAFIESMSRVRLGIPNKQTIYTASQQIIGLSNSLTLPYGTKSSLQYLEDNKADRNDLRIKEIQRLLRIYQNH